MSDGLSDANRNAELIAAVERSAYDLADALLATEDRMFYKVHPQAVGIANEHLERTGYVLVKKP